MKLETLGCLAACSLALASGTARAEVLHVAELNAARIAKLDKARTVAILVGGILEEHGPYLPSYTDGYLSERLAKDVAAAVGSRPGWTALVFPQIPLGASGANEIAGRYIFPGTYTVRTDTLRAVYMDLASQLGEAGLRTILIVHLHGAPLQNRMLDQASDFFRDTYEGRMLHVYGLMRVLEGWSAADAVTTAPARAADGYCVHACLGETSTMLHLRPDLVDSAYAKAPPWVGRDMRELRNISAKPEWPGYFGAPHLANAAAGKAAVDGLSREMVAAAMDFLDGKDDRLGPRFSDVTAKDPQEQDIDRGALAFESAIRAKQEHWLRSRGTGR
jgi:creatinine amidohydrolase/Fe(II)-dependent formamide hydrolase-like protein